MSKSPLREGERDRKRSCGVCRSEHLPSLQRVKLNGALPLITPHKKLIVHVIHIPRGRYGSVGSITVRLVAKGIRALGQ